MVKITVKLILYLALLTGGIFLAENLAPAFDGTKELPVDGFGSMSGRALLTAEKHGAREHFKRDYEEAEFGLEQARKAVSFEMGQPWLARDYSYASSKLAEAQDKVLALLVKTSRKEISDRLAAQKAIGELDQLIKKVDALFAHTSNHIVARQRFTKAKLCSKNAKTLYEKKRYASALKEASNGKSMAVKAFSTSMDILARFSDPSLVNQWAAWKARAISESRSGGVSIVVNKETHKLDLYRGGSLVKTFDAELGANSINQKLYAGDRATPEGYYHITNKKGHGQSKYNMALLINYPNGDDRARFNSLKARNQISPRSRIGGLIEIHGGGGQGFDWTDGCVALTDREMEWLFRQVSVGTAVAIIGSDGNGGPINSALKNSGGLR